jgi:leader peptidase (prepilin peptidase) / N-methyltransferase
MLVKVKEEQLIKTFILKKHYLYIVVPMVTLFTLILSFILSSDILEVIKGYIFLSIILYASICDIKTREVPDYIHLMILITGFIGIKIENIPTMIISSIIIPLPLFISAVLKKDSIGGADIKIMAACSFLLGLEKGMFAIIIGLTLAVSVTYISRKIVKQSNIASFPVVPYLAMGSFFAFLF